MDEKPYNTVFETIVEAETPRIREEVLSAEFLGKVDRMTHWLPSIDFNVAGAFLYTLMLILLALILTWNGVDLLSVLGRVTP